MHAFSEHAPGAPGRPSLLALKVYSVVRSRANRWKVLPLLLACVLLLASLGCLVHTESTHDAQATHEEHQHAAAPSSVHTPFDAHCFVATLPLGIMLLCFSLGICYVLTHRSLPAVLAFPPFIPPKTRLSA